MVTGIFCHDLPIYKDVNGVYCSTTLTDVLFTRYFHVVDELIVATRVYPIESTYVEAHQEKISLPNIKFLEFPNLNTPTGVIRLFPMAKRRLYDAMKDIDLIFIRGGILALLGVETARKLGKPYLMEAAGCAWDEYWNYSLSGKIIAPYMEWKVRQNIRDADYVIYVTEKYLQKRYPTNGISTYASNVILEKPQRDVLKKRLDKIVNTERKCPIILGTTAGIDNKAKGQQYVIEAIGRLKNEYDIYYELVGSGSGAYLRSVAKKYNVEDKIIFKGQMTHDEVLAWLDSIDIYIQPSMQEGLPRSLIEAMSRACPAIGSTTAGIPELLQENAVFKRGNVDSLIKVIKKLLKRDLRGDAQQNFKKSEEYEISLLNARREKLYEQYRKQIGKRKD